MKKCLLVSFMLIFSGASTAFADLGDLLRVIGRELLEEIGENIGERYWEGNREYCRVRPMTHNRAQQLTFASQDLSTLANNQLRWSHFTEEARELTRESREFTQRLRYRQPCWKVREGFLQLREEFRETVDAYQEEELMFRRPVLENHLERVILAFRNLRRSLR